MTGRPLVSCITIFLDAERFLTEAVESVLAQRYDRWELLLVDDGSSDGGSAIACAFAERHPDRIRYLEHARHANLGMSASRNLGIRHARGELIALLDADDLWLPEKLERQVALLAEHPRAAMVYGATTERFDLAPDAAVPASIAPPRRRTLGVPTDTLIEPPELVPLWLRGRGETPGTCGVLVRRAAVASVGGFEEEFRGLFEDQAFFYKLCLAHPVYVEGGSWDIYRRHAHSAVAIGERDAVYDPSGESAAQLRFLDWLEGYMRRARVADPACWEALRRARWPYEHPLLHRARRWLGKRAWVPPAVRGWLRRA